MTPQEIFERKLNWKPNSHKVNLHSDYKDKGMEWCKVQLYKCQWEFEEYTAPYQHTFHFEHHQDARAFMIFSKFFK